MPDKLRDPGHEQGRDLIANVDVGCQQTNRIVTADSLKRADQQIELLGTHFVL